MFTDGHVEQLTSDQISERLASAKPDEPQPEPDPEPSGPAVRTWTTADGKNTVEATFVKIEEGQVTIKRKDTGREVTLPLELLSAEDQAYIKSLDK